MLPHIRSPYTISEIYDRLREGLGKPAPICRVPAWALSLGARCGDLLETVLERRLPISSLTLQKLMGQAWYSPEAAIRDLRYQPTYTFEQAVPELVRHYLQSRS